MRKLLEIASRPASVLPTPTTILRAHTREFDRLTCDVENTDGSQTLTVYVWRRAASGSAYSKSDYDAMVSIPAGESRCVDLDVGGTLDIELRAQASGIGLSCNVGGQLVGGVP